MELAEITNPTLPPADVEALKSLRNQMCESSQGQFRLQSQQRFLRRILSPDSPNRSAMLVHGTGTGKTCTAIQIAEEYILRPEFQDQKVLIVASATVQDNFRKQLFDMTRVYLDEASGILESKQCTGRRYLDMLLRIESEPKNWANPEVVERLERTADRILGEFYEFSAYNSFGAFINRQQVALPKAEFEAWVHKTFDNRLLIVDEAHNVRESADSQGSKEVVSGLQSLVKIANGLVLVLLTATPMFDVYEEIAFYMNLFLWNERKQPATTSVKASDFFEPDGSLKPGPAGNAFRDWCSSYVSYVRGDNPFTFPFRLPPPKTISVDPVTKTFGNKPLNPTDRVRYLLPYLVESVATETQKQVLVAPEEEELMEPTIAVLPERKSFKELFSMTGKQYAYTTDPFLTPAELPKYAAKFVSVLKSIEAGKGIALVYSNYVTMGARLFAMALEEHGYGPAFGTPLLANPAYSGPSKGQYILLTSGASDAELSRMIEKAKARTNRDGNQVRIIISSPIVSEGVDFRYVRQIHILDPWWNMSRIEQVIGRGLRTCSHQLLPFPEQNCTVYLHVVRTGEGTECFDEYTYRTKVEPKAIKIARVRKVMAESAMDCPLQNQLNTLPEDWKALEIPQMRSEGGRVDDVYPLFRMLAPPFDDDPDVRTCNVKSLPEDPDHVRPLSTYLDVRDELLEKVGLLLLDKPIWDRDQLFVALRPYTQDVIIYNLQQAIASGFRFKDAFGRPSVLESKGDLYALAPLGTPNATLVERTTLPPARGRTPLPTPSVAPPRAEETVSEDILTVRRAELTLPGDAVTRFSEEVVLGYVFDHLLTESERRAYLKTRPARLPFADRLFVPDSEYIVLGYNTFEPSEPPVGEDETRFREWRQRLVARFIETKDQLFASLTQTQKFAISKMKIEGDKVVRIREKTAKNYMPIVCGTGENKLDLVLAFAKYIDKNGVGVPADIAKVTTACVYAELLAREEHNCVWWTPEERSVLYDDTRTLKDSGEEGAKAIWTKEFKK